MLGILNSLFFFVLVVCAGLVEAHLRFTCSQLVTERFDPLVTPGRVSPHVHQIVGGNAFNISMDPVAGDISKLATCTTCEFVEDKSNYWTAVLYFKHPNGSFIRVEQMANHNTGPGLQAGGMTVYYFQPREPTRNLNLTIFPPGFRMIVGNPLLRSHAHIDVSTTAAHATSFRCFMGTDPGPLGSPGKEREDSVGLPPGMCTGGIRTNIFFPQCWDGVHLDTPDHASHVAHPAGVPSADGLQFFGTDCPDTHPVRVPLLFLEIVWDTRPFNVPELWPKDGGQPFVLSMGDPTGYGQHADYVFGWEADSLKRAMDTCTRANGAPRVCEALTRQPMSEMNSCRVPVQVDEVVEGRYIERLPGCGNEVWHGPANASAPPLECEGAPSTTVEVPLPVTSQVVVVPPWPILV